MAFNITGSKEIVKQIPKEYQNSFASLLKKKKFPKDTFLVDQEVINQQVKVIKLKFPDIY